MNDPRLPSPWPDPFRPFEAALLRFYSVACAWRDGCASQDELMQMLGHCEAAEDAWFASLETAKPAPAISEVA